MKKLKPNRSSLPVDEIAAVIDNHTGRVRMQASGFGAEADMRSAARTCKTGKVDHLSSTSVITGKAAAIAIKNGRV
ncbi:hypothetical protein LCGC14_1353580 [marine sediment metagenome]|uniref:Uncharacterized protein n=1 Tax=marine sediment metagenome TaxID=412755 RepID=A0A0F9KW97_9ZZZZ